METLAAQSLELLSPGYARGRGQVPQNNATHPRSVDNYCQHRTGEEECKNRALLFWGNVLCPTHEVAFDIPSVWYILPTLLKEKWKLADADESRDLNSSLPSRRYLPTVTVSSEYRSYHRVSSLTTVWADGKDLL